MNHKIIIAEYDREQAEYFWRYRCNDSIYIRVRKDLMNEVYKVYKLTKDCDFKRVKSIMDKDEQCIILVPMEEKLLKALAEANYFTWAHFPSSIGWEKAADILKSFDIDSGQDTIVMASTSTPLYDYMNTFIINTIKVSQLKHFGETGEMVEEGYDV